MRIRALAVMILAAVLFSLSTVTVSAYDVIDVSVNAQNTSAGSTLVIPVTLNRIAGSGVISCGFAFSYDTSKLTLIEVSKGPLIDLWENEAMPSLEEQGQLAALGHPWKYPVFKNDNGIVKIALYGRTPVLSDGEIARLTFKVADNVSGETTVSITQTEIGSGEVILASAGSSAPITIIRPNRAPALESIPAKTINEGETLSLIQGTDLKASDPDGDAVSFIFSAPLDANGSWKPGYKDAGIYQIAIKATDGSLESTPQIFALTVTNVGPYQSKTIETMRWNENEAKQDAIDLDDYFINPDQDSLNYSVNYLSQDHKIAASINPTTHTVSFSQSPGFSGTETLTFTATDSIEQDQSVISNPITLQVVGVENPPKIEGALTITPADGFSTNKKEIKVIYKVDDKEYSDLEKLESEGVNSIIRTTTDEVGNTVAARITVYRDTQAPEVRITSPADNAIVIRSPIEVTYTVDGKEYKDTQELSEGPNTISRQLSDESGNTGIHSVKVKLKTKVKINIINPGKQFLTPDDLIGTQNSSVFKPRMNAFRLPRRAQEKSILLGAYLASRGYLGNSGL